jgi:hypothetical protein
MADFLLSPEGAKFISGFFAGAALSIVVLRFALAEKTRILIVSKFTGMIRGFWGHIHGV